MKGKKIAKILAVALIGGTMSVAVACNEPPQPTYYDVTLNGSTESIIKDGLLEEPTPLQNYEAYGYLYVFEGWQYTDGNGNTKLWNFETDKVTSNVTLTPKFSQTEIPLTVTFKNGDTTVHTSTVNKSNGKVTAPDIPKSYDDVENNKHYTFEYWYVTVNGADKVWNFNSDKVTENIVIYAKYSFRPLTVEVNFNGETVNVNYGETLPKPATNPTKESDAQYDYTFSFWMCNGNIFDFSTQITEPLTIEAYFKKTERTYDITIDLDNGTEVISKQKVTYGTPLIQCVPYDIVKNSTVDKVYTFSHFVNGEGVTVTEVDGSSSYVAVYTEATRQYDVTYVVDGKSQTVKVDYGSNVLDVIGTPTKVEDDDAKYDFVKWIDEDGNTVDADVTVAEDATYTAVFDTTYKRYLITFEVGGKRYYKKINVGEKIEDYLPANTDKPTDPALGIIYTFSHWEDSQGNTVTGDTLVEKVETYIAMYDEEEYNGTLSISDVFATKESGRWIPAVFSKTGFTAPLTYTFDGNDISISEAGYITVNNVGKTVTVTAKNEEYGLEDTFTVTTYDKRIDYVSTNYSTSYASNNFDKVASRQNLLATKVDDATPLMIFMGDSFFDTDGFWTNFYTSSFFMGKNIYSYGVSGSRSDEMMDWMSDVITYNPKAIAIHVGTNDIYDLGKSGEATGRSIVDMLAALHYALPNTQIYYYSVEYRTYARGGETLAYSNSQADISNSIAKTYCDTTVNVTYLDSLKYLTTNGVSSGGYIDSTKLRDSVHVALDNYHIYTDLLVEAGVNFNDYVLKIKKPIQQATGEGTVTLDGDTLTINNAGKGTRTRAYLYDTENQKYIQGNVAVWGTLNMKDIVVANNQFAEILLMENPDDSWATANNYNIIDLVIRKHSGQNVVKPVIWGYGVGGENSAYKWDDNDYSIEFSLVVKDKKAYITLDGVTKTIELKSDSLYIGFGSENLNYTITGFTVSTDSSVINSKIPQNAVINDVEEFTTDINLGVRGNEKVITLGGNPLSTEFIISGKLDLISAPASSNAHIEFKFNGNDNYRFLLWDNNDNVNYNYKVAYNMGAGYDTNASSDDIFTFGSEKLTLTWKIVVTGGYQMFYVNDELRVVNKGGADVTAFNLSAEKAQVRFYDIKAYMSSNDPEGFATQKALVQSDINTYSSSANGTYRV